MAGYIGSKASVVSSGAERKKVFAITTSTTSLTGLVYTPNMVHVFHNGIRLVDGTDYTATDGTTITLTNAAANGDEVVVVSYAAFQTSDTVSASAGGTFAGDVTLSGADLSFGDNDKAIFGAGSDLQIYHTGNHSYIDDAGTGNLYIRSTNFRINNAGDTQQMFAANDGGAVQLFNNGGLKLATTSTGVDVTGDITLSGGVYLGGTGSANHLDDYEEGTWTPSVPSAFSITTNRSCTYTKIGRLVHLTANLNITGTASDSTQLLISGLPFAQVGGTTGRGNAVPWVDRFVCGDDDGYPVAGIYDGVTWIRHWVTRSNTNLNQIDLTAAMINGSTGSEYQLNIQYYAA